MGRLAELRSTTSAELNQSARRAVTRALPGRSAERIYAQMFRARWGFPAPPPWSDWTWYERLLVEIRRHGVHEIPGDVVEIGVLLGGGTYKLCQFYARMAPTKRVIAIDVFDPEFDATTCTEGQTMAELYGEVLAGRNQREIFDEVTSPCTNLVVLAQDSASVELPADAISFAYIDGNHSAAYVRGDFELVWSKLSPGGVVAFDDYGRDIPDVTVTLHELIGEHARDIARVWALEPKTLFIQRKE